MATTNLYHINDILFIATNAQRNGEYAATLARGRVVNIRLDKESDRVVYGLSLDWPGDVDGGIAEASESDVSRTPEEAMGKGVSVLHEKKAALQESAADYLRQFPS